MTPISPHNGPYVRLCAGCGHPAGDHASNRSNTCPRYGICLRGGCDCTEFREPAESEPFPELKQDAWRIYSDAMLEHQPTHVFALFSGGNDSAVLTHWAKRELGERLDAAVFIDTGTAIPSMPGLVGPREFAETFCADREIPLLVYDAGDAYLEMVARHGVPGPGAHRYPYVLLKERQVEALVRDHKCDRLDRIMLLTGVRRAESTRRMGTTEPVSRKGAQVWVAPLTDWTNQDMREYRLEHGLPQSDVAALLHRSGECQCGAFAKPGEREELLSLFGDRWDLIERAEAAARAACMPAVWGQRQVLTVEDGTDVGPLCSGCLFDVRDELEEAA